MFISVLYRFRATSCSSSGDSIVPIRHLMYVTLCRWSSSLQVGKELSHLHTRRSPTQSDAHQMSYWENWFSWWWARGCSKPVEYWNKSIEKRMGCQIGCLQELYQEARSTKQNFTWSQHCLSRKTQHSEMNITINPELKIRQHEFSAY